MSTQSLKSGWKMVKFGEVVKNANLVERDPETNDIERIVGLEHIDPENLHIRRWNSVADGTSFTRKFVPGQTLFGKRRAYQRKVVQAEKQVDPVDEQAKAKAALTELFAEVKNGKTPMVVERIVTDIDEIVRLVRFPGWQNTKSGEREVQKALRKVIYVKYHVKDQDLFDKAFGYIRQYY